MIVTVIPVAPPDRAKSRLSAVLERPERAALVERLLRRAIDAASPLGPVLVVTRSRNLRTRLPQLGAEPVVELGHDLNGAVAQGLAVASTRAEAALVLPADLPRVTTAALQGVVDAGARTGPTIVVTPCQREEGTTALFVRPPDVIEPRYGPDSFTHHVRAGRAARARTVVHRDDALVDVDLPDDWRRYVAPAFHIDDDGR